MMSICLTRLFFRLSIHALDAIDPCIRLAKIDMGRKLGVCPLYGGGELGLHLTQCRLDAGLPFYQVACWFIDPFGHNRYGPKIEGCALWGGDLGSHLTQCGQGWYLAASQVSSWSVQPFGHNTPTLQTDRQTDRQTVSQSGETTVW